MEVIVQKGGNARNRETFVGEVQYIPGIGKARAASIYDGETVRIVIPPEKQEVAGRNLKRFMLDGTLIVTGLPGVTQEEIKTLETLPIQTPAPVLVNPVPAGIDDNAAALLELLRKLGGGISEGRVLELIHANASRPAHVTIDLTAPGVELSGTALMHHKFPLLAAAVAARVNVMLVGPAGSGKTTAVEKVAQALNLPFYGTGAVSSEYKLTGFIDAQGRIVSTAFRKAFEFGGVFLFGETDGSMPGALLAFNTALANGWMDFPDGAVQKHPDFRVVADANTFGTGADRLYVGRNQLDAASLDRYAVLDWPYDEALEAAMIGADAPKGAPAPRSIEPLPAERVQAVANQWVERVRKVRSAVNELKIRHVVSPRATVNGSRLLAAGFTWAEAEDAVIWKGLDADTRGKVIAKAA
jgi:hypothetical protein